MKGTNGRTLDPLQQVEGSYVGVYRQVQPSNTTDTVTHAARDRRHRSGGRGPAGRLRPPRGA